MKQVDLIKVRTYGDKGPNIVLLHGGPGAPGEMAQLAHHLCNNFQIIEPLQRISGDVPLTVARHVSDLYDVLRTPLRQGLVRLVGHSWGAMLALTYAARHPVEVERVILIGCGTFDKRSREAYQSSINRRLDSNDQNRINNIQSKLANENNHQRRNELFAELGAIFTLIQSVKPLTTNSQKLNCDEQGFRETWNDVISLQERGIQPAEFARIKAPVTMIHGDEDPHPGLLIYKSLVTFIQHLQYREVPKCGHTPWIERAAKDQFFQILMECLS